MGPQCIGLPAASIKGGNELGPTSLTQGFLGHGCFEVRDELLMGAGPQAQLRKVLDSHSAHFVEALSGGHTSELIEHISQSRTPPHCQGPFEELLSPFSVT
jgi:hypothetical protein